MYKTASFQKIWILSIISWPLFFGIFFVSGLWFSLLGENEIIIGLFAVLIVFPIYFTCQSILKNYTDFRFSNKKIKLFMWVLCLIPVGICSVAISSKNYMYITSDDKYIESGHPLSEDYPRFKLFRIHYGWPFTVMITERNESPSVELISILPLGFIMVLSLMSFSFVALIQRIFIIILIGGEKRV